MNCSSALGQLFVSSSPSMNNPEHKNLVRLLHIGPRQCINSLTESSLWGCGMTAELFCCREWCFVKQDFSEKRIGSKMNDNELSSSFLWQVGKNLEKNSAVEWHESDLFFVFLLSGAVTLLLTCLVV